MPQRQFPSRRRGVSPRYLAGRVHIHRRKAARRRFYGRPCERLR
jgi:hypothetical protein